MIGDSTLEYLKISRRWRHLNCLFFYNESFFLPYTFFRLHFGKLTCIVFCYLLPMFSTLFQKSYPILSSFHHGFRFKVFRLPLIATLFEKLHELSLWTFVGCVLTGLAHRSSLIINSVARKCASGLQDAFRAFSKAVTHLNH